MDKETGLMLINDLLSNNILRLEVANVELLAALKEIAKGEGAFSLDPLTFANSTIENMKDIANTALNTARAAVAESGEVE